MYSKYFVMIALLACNSFIMPMMKSTNEEYGQEIAFGLSAMNGLSNLTTKNQLRKLAEISKNLDFNSKIWFQLIHMYMRFPQDYYAKSAHEQSFSTDEILSVAVQHNRMKGDFTIKHQEVVDVRNLFPSLELSQEKTNAIINAIRTYPRPQSLIVNLHREFYNNASSALELCDIFISNDFMKIKPSLRSTLAIFLTRNILLNNPAQLEDDEERAMSLVYAFFIQEKITSHDIKKFSKDLQEIIEANYQVEFNKSL